MFSWIIYLYYEYFHKFKRDFLWLLMNNSELTIWKSMEKNYKLYVKKKRNFSAFFESREFAWTLWNVGGAAPGLLPLQLSGLKPNSFGANSYGAFAPAIIGPRNWVVVWRISRGERMLARRIRYQKQKLGIFARDAKFMLHLTWCYLACGNSRFPCCLNKSKVNFWSYFNSLSSLDLNYWI